jgi:CRISPR/Cas system CSM-associated protein Csm3 (group 7 of RAMP superfamily)
MKSIKIEYRWKIITSLFVGSSSESLRSDLDGITYFNSEGLLSIPGTTIKGKLRAKAEKILRTLGEETCTPPSPENTCPHYFGGNLDKFCPACQIFGSPWLHSSLRFAQATLEDRDIEMERNVQNKINYQISIRPGTTVSRRRGVVEEGKLFFFGVSSPGSEFVLKGAIEGFFPNGDFSEPQLGLLLASLKSVKMIGGGKSRGLGWIGLEGLSVWVDAKVLTEEEIKKTIGEIKVWQRQS